MIYKIYKLIINYIYLYNIIININNKYFNFLNFIIINFIIINIDFYNIIIKNIRFNNNNNKI